MKILQGKACHILGAKTPHFLDFPDNQLDKIPLLDIVKIFRGFY